MSDRWPGTFADAERETLLGGLALSPAERLAWLEEALEFVSWLQDLPRVDHSRVTSRAGPDTPAPTTESPVPSGAPDNPPRAR